MTIAEILCKCVFVLFFEVSRSNNHLTFAFKYFLHTQYRLLTFFGNTSMYYVFCDKVPKKDTIHKISANIVRQASNILL